MKLKLLKNSQLLKYQNISIFNDKEDLVNKYNSLTSKISVKKLNLYQVESNQGNTMYNNLYLPVPKKRRKYMFGDFVSFVNKYNMLHRFALLKKGIQTTTHKFDVEIRRKYKSLRKNSIHNFNFDKYLRNIFFSVNFNFEYYKRNYQGKLNSYKLFHMIRKYIFLMIFKRIKFFIKIKINKAIKIQSVVRRFIFQKKYNIWKENLIKKIVLIQKNVRRFLVKKKYKRNLVSIIDFIKYNQKVKIYDQNLKIMIAKRNAIRVIENWWEQILEQRRQKELEKQIRIMPKDCQHLYRQFIRLGKQTKVIKKDLKDFIRKTKGFIP